MRNPFSRKPVVAAASIASSERTLERGAVMSRSVSQAWEVWRQVGEIHYATTQQSRLVSRVEWDVVIGGKQLGPEDALRLLKEAFGRNFRELVKQQTLHIQVAGAYNLLRTGDRQWEIVASPADHQAQIRMSKADIIVHNIVPDPKNPSQPDSPVLAAVDVARELILARAQARASARNRTAQLNTVIYPLEGAGPDSEDFEKKFTRVMTAPLENENSVSVVVPNLIGFQGDWIDKWKTLDLTGPIDKNLHEKIPLLIQQLAVILDAPPQILLGMSDLNHWAAWAVQEDNWFSHVEPLASTVGDGLALGLARALGLDPEEVEVNPDPAPLLKRRPSLQDILKAYEDALVNGEFVRRHLGAGPDDEPTPEEREEIIRGSANAGGPGRPKAVGEEPLTEEGPQAAAASGPSLDARLLAEIDNQAYDAVEDLATDVVDRALERLGAKVRSIGQGRDLGIEGAEALPNAELALRYSGSIPNADDTVALVVEGFNGKLARIMDRAYSRVRDLGVDLKQREEDRLDAEVLFTVLVQERVHSLLSRENAISPWRISRRVIAVAGGNGDLLPVVAAPVMRTSGSGIALGVYSRETLRNMLGLIAREYVWLHIGGGNTDHPQHMAFDGRVFDGQSIYENNINWFPGDHDGCRCIAVPVLGGVA